MKRKSFFIFLLVCLLCLPTLALGASRGREPLFTFALDQAHTENFKYDAYFKGRWVQFTAPVAQGSDVKLQLYADTDQNAATKDSRVFSQTFKNVSGVFTSPEICLDYKKSATVPYRVELYENDVLTRSAYIYRMLLPLSGNTVTTRGIRFRDMNKAITDKWMMFTPVDLSAIDPRGGTKVIDLIGSNMYVVGKFTITRSGDQFMFTLTDIDSWNAAYGTEDAQPQEAYVDIYNPYYPLRASHNIDISRVRIQLIGNLNYIESVEYEDMDTFFRPGVWYSIRSNLGGETVWGIYLNGRISYDPNGLIRITDTYDGPETKPLRKLLQRFPNTEISYR